MSTQRGFPDPSHRPDLRIGDAERDAVVSALREHYARGRLTLAELDERLGLALAARTGGDLAALTDDLPAPDGPAWPDRPSDRPRRPPHPPWSHRHPAGAGRGGPTRWSWPWIPLLPLLFAVWLLPAVIAGGGRLVVILLLFLLLMGRLGLGRHRCAHARHPRGRLGAPR